MAARAPEEDAVEARAPHLQSPMAVRPAAALGATAALGFSYWLYRRLCAKTDASEAVVHLAVVFSGKRKSGKDYCSDKLLALVGDSIAEIGSVSAPLKRAYAEEHGLDYAELLTASAYKEKHRKPMIAWGEARRHADPGFFARKVLDAATRPVLIVSDARRPGDVDFFLKRVKTVVRVRVSASEATRAARGWAFAAGVDDAESECGLDDYAPWEFVVANDPGNDAAVDVQLRRIATLCRDAQREAAAAYHAAPRRS